MNLRNKLISCALITGIIFTATMSPTKAIGSCIDCHNDIWQDAQKKRYIHRPVANKQCTSCHTGDMDGDIAGEQKQTTQPEQSISTVIAEFNQQQQITWLAETFTPATQHFVLLDGQHANSTINIEAWPSSRDKVQFDLPIPALTTIAPTQLRPTLTIDNLHIRDNNDILLAHATVAWDTSSPSRCQITYSANNNEYSLAEDDLYTAKHAIVLHNCSQHDLLHIECEDPLGVQLTTEPQKLASLPHHYAPSKTTQGQMLTEAMISFDFKKLNQNIWLELSAPLPFSVSIGTTGHQDSKTNNTPSAAVDINAPVPEPLGKLASSNSHQTATNEHDQLLSPRAINLTICYRCHQEMLGWTSHPVDVAPQPGMIIPPEYPLLPDGRISCMTCHSVHSSNREYRLIKDSKRELCTGCHVNY